MPLSSHVFRHLSPLMILAAPAVANIIAVAITASTASIYPAIVRAGSVVTCAATPLSALAIQSSVLPSFIQPATAACPAAPPVLPPSPCPAAFKRVYRYRCLEVLSILQKRLNRKYLG
jgi:hypothetical protein